MASEEGVATVSIKKDVQNRKPPIETASWCYRDKEEDVHHDFAWTITNFSRKINVVPNSKSTLQTFQILLKMKQNIVAKLARQKYYFFQT